MPIVNETQTVVERIKKRLVERTVSAEQLAERVGMRYDAMLSALAGKTVFDAPTLKRIAAYLGMEEESLIAFESGTKEEDSPYYKAVKGGMLAVKRLESERDQVNIPDNTGKYLIEYAVDARDNKLFEYMLSGCALPLYPSPTKARALLKIAVGCLRAKLNPENYMETFFGEAKTDSFTGAVAEEFFAEVEKTGKTDLVDRLLAHKGAVTEKVFGPIKKTRSESLLTPERALVLAAKVRGERLAGYLLPKTADRKASCYALAETGFLKGLVSALSALKRDDELLAAAIEQKCALAALRGGSLETLKAMTERGNTDPVELLLLALSLKNEEAADYLATFAKEVNAERLALRAAESGILSTFVILEKKFAPTAQFYNAALAISCPAATELNLYLCSKGALFTKETQGAVQKANRLTERLLAQAYATQIAPPQDNFTQPTPANEGELNLANEEASYGSN